MTASELVDLATEGALAALPGDVWLSDRSWTRPHWTVDELVAAKAGRTISVVLPALNEEDTVESVIDSISPLVGGLVDELIVLDSGSTDDTEIRAIAAGARVVTREQALPHIPPRPGKGEVLWRSLAATEGDFVVFVDSDLIDPHPMFVPRMLGPLLAEDGVHLVKSFYRRPLNIGDVSDSSGRDGATGGGRVTELVARPLLGLWWPELSGVIQPLAGEWAARRELMESLPIPVGYGVELATLLDTAARHGLDALAQVDLGSRAHKHQTDHDLALMAAELLMVAERRRPVTRVAGAEGESEPDGPLLTQFLREDGQVRPVSRPVPTRERPPVAALVSGASGGVGGPR